MTTTTTVYLQVHVNFRRTTRRLRAALRSLGHASELAGHKVRRFERQAAKRPEQTALWTAYRAKTRRRNRRR